MDFNAMMDIEGIDFKDISMQPFLLGLLSAFDNRYQACADSFFKEITWKQFFAIICINLCEESPTINELSDVMGSSHQNVKQILIKLEKVGFVEMIQDDKDRRKQRIILTEKCRKFCEDNDAESQRIIGQIFEGIGQEELMMTIKTILTMESNLGNIR